MMRARKFIAGLFAIVLVLSAWTGAGAMCEMGAALTTASASASKDAHAHHATNTASQDHEGMDHSKHLAASGGEAEHESSVECPCCGSCASMCVLSSGSPIVTSAATGLFAVGAGAERSTKADAFRAGPTPHAPYRPPILSA